LKDESGWMNVFQASSRWDRNWDRRDPASYVKPKLQVTDSNNNVDPGADSTGPRNDIEKMTPHTSRHIFLIRHGHYNINGEADDERGLTELGKRFQSTINQLIVGCVKVNV
jgi:serine/threonine-protein phosphatase PGAM5